MPFANIPIFGEIGPSKGQFHVLGISFLHSISGTTNCHIPIFFDTPLGRIDKEHKVNIGSNLPLLFKGSQIILFLTGEEANNMIEYIQGRNGWKINNPRNLQATLEEIPSTELIRTIEEIQEEDAVKT